jgi:hypothetical protein
MQPLPRRGQIVPHEVFWLDLLHVRTRRVVVHVAIAAPDKLGMQLYTWIL